MQRKGPHKLQRHLHRYRQILTILIAYGFQEVLSIRKRRFAGLKGKSDLSPEETRRIKNLSRGERLRKVLEALGPTYIKFGQIMSSRPDILSPEFIQELEKLQSSVSPFEGDIALAIIEQELGKTCKEIFKSFDKEPLASASIAQVHKGTLNDGRSVVVKVRRPEIISVVETDIEIMLNIIPVFEKVFLRSESLNTRKIIEEFGNVIRREMDFTNEANTIQRVKENFSGNPDIYVPEVIKSHSTKSILTMEYIDGIPVSNITALRERGYNCKKLAAVCVQLMAEQIFGNGFFHADPHPGNTFVLPGHRICFLDFGMMGSLFPGQREYLCNMMIGISTQNIQKITRGLQNLCLDANFESREEFEYEIFHIVETYAPKALQNINMGILFLELINLIVSFNLKLPPNIFVLGKSLVSIEGTARKLYPDLNTVEEMEPFVRKILLSRYDPIRLGKETLLSFSELLDLIKESPGNFQDIFSWLKKGKLKLDFDLYGTGKILERGEKLINRLTFAIMFTSIVTASSLIINARIPPLFHDISIIGIAGLALSLVIGVGLVFSIFMRK